MRDVVSTAFEPAAQVRPAFASAGVGRHAALSSARRRGVFLALAFALLLSVLACLVPTQRAWADLTVYVGYAGGPYYEKKTYTEAELWALSDGTIYEYSGVDAGGALRKGFGVGVTMYNLFTNAGIDPDSMWRFFFSTEDNYIVDDGGAGTDAWYYSNLEYTPRYYYPDLVNYFNFDTGEIESEEAMGLIEQTRERTPTILALESSYGKVFSVDDETWTDLSDIDRRDSGYRLLYGQTAPNVSNSRTSAHSIKAVTCILGGNEGTNLPEVDLGIDDGHLEMEVGESYTFFPTLKSEDPTVSKNGIHDVTWRSSDETVATVRQNDDGSVTITIVGEGEVSIGYSFGNSPYDAYRTSGQFGMSGTGSGNGEGSGEGGGDSDEGDSSHSGEGAAGNITLSEGAEMFSASMEASAEGGGGPEVEAAEAGAGDAAVEEMLEITATRSVYELDMPFEDTEVVDDRPAWEYALLAGSCLAVGGVRRRMQFERAKDPFMTERELKEKR